MASVVGKKFPSIHTKKKISFFLRPSAQHQTATRFFESQTNMYCLTNLFLECTRVIVGGPDAQPGVLETSWGNFRRRLTSVINETKGVIDYVGQQSADAKNQLHKLIESETTLKKEGKDTDHLNNDIRKIATLIVGLSQSHERTGKQLAMLMKLDKSCDELHRAMILNKQTTDELRRVFDGLLEIAEHPQYRPVALFYARAFENDKRYTPAGQSLSAIEKVIESEIKLPTQVDENEVAQVIVNARTVLVYDALNAVSTPVLRPSGAQQGNVSQPHPEPPADDVR